ncbi:hypothetical protein HU200_024275 [Digitaria exilis]|uniref:Uncharacterized protein n=1 Tax=Digitaria exilis TaxID=1010633 RepID=A0A835CBE5_9POAL|nr:hypothetical protein HU200_024275 [Digitaria exilis]
MTILEKFGTRLHWNISRSSPASCWNHHKAVTHIDIVWVYTFGGHLLCHTPVGPHDIGEALQEKLE